MAVFLKVDEKHRFFLAQFVGTVDDALLLSTYERLQKWLAKHGNYSGIADFSETESFEVTAHGVESLVAIAPLIPEGCQRIVIAPQDEAFGMSRMYQILRSVTRSYRMQICRSHEEACRLAGTEQFNFEPFLDW